MPRNGSDIYSIPPGTEGFPDTTIESAKYNTYVHDVETDLNTPRPIVAGGTGANDADEALINLSAEKSSAEVTNYDSHVWIPGSFYSASTATGAPISGRPFVGIVVSSDLLQDPPLNQNVVVHARDQNDNIVPGRLYVREKKAGVWGPWKPDGVSLYTSDTPPTGAPDNSLWWETDTGLLYVRYNDEAGAPQWVIACPQPDISTFAAINSPTFTGDPKAPTPPPGDDDTSIATTAFVQSTAAVAQMAMAYSGMQINGGMEVSQERGDNPVASNNFVCDGWWLANVSTALVDGVRGTGTDVTGFPCVLAAVVQTGATIGSGDFAFFRHSIEGYRIARLAWGSASAQPITISFWTKHDVTGLYSVAVRNGAGNRSYAATYTHNVASVAQYNTITVPGCTDGTWYTDNGTGIELDFTLASGSFASAANVWTATGAIAAPGQVNALATTGKFLRFTGVTVLPGTQAPTAAQSPNIMRPYDQELATCQRYFHRGIIGIIAYGTGGSLVGNWYLHPTTMRAAPTVGLAAPSGTYTNCTSPVIDSATTSSFRFFVNVSGTGNLFVDAQPFYADARL